ncbi:MAG TPA: YbfB/YjiJ family MFS transporter [Magnetospirillaceae bacterium]|nr:YbfB/YjiJ family MFS transporter [Magnetospirillaceae bacterium]
MRSVSSTAPQEAVLPNPWRATAAALSATLVGLGLARFAFAPLVPALIAEHWFSPAQAAYLGSANFAGYLAGALLAQPVSSRIAPAHVLRAMMLLAGLSFLASAHPAPFLWFAAWRAVAGISGGLIMVLSATLVLQHVPVHRRGLAGGAIFAGVGIGVIIAAALVPRLIAIGLPVAWNALGALCVVLAVVTWTSWPADAAGEASRERPPIKAEVLVLFAVYALNAIGLVPHTMFLVDMTARELGYGLAAGAGMWLLFGIGAIIGPLAAGRIGDTLGFRPVLLAMLLLQAGLVGLASLTANLWALAFSALMMGGCTAGIVPVVLGRVRELIPHDPRGQRAAWSLATTAFAIGQAGGAFALSGILGAIGQYPPLFGISAAALLLAFAIKLLQGRVS